MQDQFAIFLVFCIASSVLGSGLAAPSTFNVIDFGAIGDGKADDTAAFLKAWQALCGDPGAGGVPILNIPGGKTFLLRPLTFNGSCKSPSVQVQVLGTIIAPNTLGAWTDCNVDSWLLFTDVSRLIITGTGVINGQGSIWWNKKIATRDINVKQQCIDPPTALKFHNCNNLQLSGLNHVDSPRNHIGIDMCPGVTVSNIHITAPKDSPNTDGIDISFSTEVIIVDSTISTGDDCIAINGGCSNINITRLACGPGHGISVGSLGKNGANETVEGVHVFNCSFTGTQNGARIKTWQGGSGFVRNITFEQIILVAAENPIIIDQFYGNPDSASAVKISDVTYKGVEGTSASGDAIKLNCDKITGCSNIVMDQVNITSSTPPQTVDAVCQNANGTAHLTTPTVPCLNST